MIARDLDRFARLSSAPAVPERTIGFPHSVNWKIISRHRNTLGLKDRDDHHLHSDAADRLHLMSCGSQNSTEVRQALQECDRTRTRALQPEPAPKKNWILFSTITLNEHIGTI